MELIEKLGIDWRLLIAQIINFLILIFVLHRFAYKPILRMMKKRTETIEKSLSDAKKIEENLIDSEKKHSEIINQARREARDLLGETSQRADSLRQERIKEANQEVEKMIEAAKLEITQSKEKMMQDVKAEVAGLVIETAEKVIESKMDKKNHNGLIEKTLAELSQQRQ